jgi:hypothetical protein
MYWDPNCRNHDEIQDKHVAHSISMISYRNTSFTGLYIQISYLSIYISIQKPSDMCGKNTRRIHAKVINIGSLNFNESPHAAFFVCKISSKCEK